MLNGEFAVEQARRVAGKALAGEFPGKAQCLVPTIVQLELSKWLVHSIFTLTRDVYGDSSTKTLANRQVWHDAGFDPPER